MTSYDDKEQEFQCVLAEKERIIDDLQTDNERYRAELNEAKDFIQQLKQEQLSMKQQLDNDDKVMMEKLRAKDEVLAEIKEVLVMKQKSFDEAVSKHLIELEELQEVTRGQSEKILTLEKEVVDKDEELVITRKEMFDLKEQLAEQSDLLSTEMANELEEWQKESKEQSDKILALQQEVTEKGEELAAAKSEMSNLHHELVKQSDLLSATMTSYAEKEQAFQNVLADKERIIGNLQSDVEMYMAKLNDSKDLMQQLKLEHLSEKEELEKEMMEKVGVNDEALAKLKEQLITNQNILDATVNKHSIELKEWKKQIEEESEKISILAETEEKLVATRNEMSDMNDELTQQSNLLSAEVAYTRSLKQSLTDKERIIDQLKEDIATYQTEANNNKHHMSELEKDYLSVKQELDNKNKKEVAKEAGVKSKGLAKIKEELFAKQNSLVDRSVVKKQSIELEMLQMKSQGQLDKIKSLKQEVYKKNKELSAVENKIFDLNCQLKQRSDQMREVKADKDRMIKKLQADIERYQNDAKDLTSQPKVKQSSVEHADNEKKEVLEPKGQSDARDGVLIMQSKGKDNTLSNEVKAIIDGEKEMLGAVGQTAEGRDGVLIVQSKEKDNTLSNEVKAVSDGEKEILGAGGQTTEGRNGVLMVQSKKKDNTSSNEVKAVCDGENEILGAGEQTTEGRNGVLMVQSKKKDNTLSNEVKAVGDGEKEILGAGGQTAEGRDGVLIVQSKKKDNTLSNEVKAVGDGEKEILGAGEQTAEGRDGVLIVQSKKKDNTLSNEVKAVGDGEKEILGAGEQTAEGKDGVLIVQSKEKDNSLPNQAKDVRQEVEERVITDMNKPIQRADSIVYIIPNNSKEVSHQKC